MAARNSRKPAPEKKADEKAAQASDADTVNEAEKQEAELKSETASANEAEEKAAPASDADTDTDTGTVDEAEKPEAELKAELADKFIVDGQVLKASVQTVRGKKRHRRSGINFTREAQVIDLEQLGPEKAFAVLTDPKLIAEPVKPDA
jgi:hypothetical protein